MNEDIYFLKLAIENSRKSMNEGNFPAGAIVVNDDKVLSSDISSPFPNLFHADSKAVSSAFKKYGVLTGAVLYIGLQPCLMCTGVAYWAGIRRIVYAIPKSKVSGDYYETANDTDELFKTFNEQIEFVHISELEQEAIKVIMDWEAKNSNDTNQTTSA
ncbi:nucleoside deaminase [Candidatus Dojkabacteria bacterium]|uniref:Nucleoside deaminase n=1 Tax=Candidatus Dojkabacteria bacterium TaxID=2099670 RepID=A0A955L3H0_9BACT|nr:nucleoside deaminase [Candidatus Dojkabacteria bacterium]